MAGGDNDGMSAEAIATLFFGQSDSIKCSAVFRKLYADSIQFRFKNNLFFSRDE